MAAVREPATRRATRPAADEPFRIIALDGGCGALLTVLVLEQIEEKRPGFLANTNMLAGTSAGSMTAAILAAKKDPADQIDALKVFWTNTSDSFTNTTMGFLGALLGVNALYGKGPLQTALSRPALLGSLKLNELAKSVAIPAFHLKNMEGTIFSNFRSDMDGYADLAVDVILRSSAAPLLFPGHQGFIDGGIFKNNPTLSAAAVVLSSSSPRAAESARVATRRESRKITLRALPSGTRHGEGETLVARILSLGGGRDAGEIDIGDQSWGYLQWMFNLSSPFLLANTALQGADAIAGEDGVILPEIGGAPTYFRLDPGFVNKSLLPFIQADPKDLEETATSEKTKELVEKACEFLDETGWV